MNLTDALAAGAPQRRNVPKQFTAGVTFTSGELTEATVNVRDIPADEQGWRDAIKDATGVTVPEHREVVLTGVRLWTMGPIENKHLTFRIVDRSTGDGNVDYAELIKIAARNTKTKPPKRADIATTRTRVIGLSDEQIGKVDREGGTPAFLERVARLLALLEQECRNNPAVDAVILLGGDLIEGFQSTGSEAHTNDLSHPDMLRVARAYLTEAITRIAALHDRVTVLAVPSNHSAWRRGKDYLGKPGDDYGLDCVRAVAETLAMSARWAHIQFMRPDDWDVTIALPVRDDVIALTHGHVGTNGPASFAKWFAGQVLGDSAIGNATIVVSGHYHHRRVEPLGNLGGRERVHIQLPALDGGSSHFTNARGEWAQAGIWTALVCDGHGLDYERVIR